jgi:hypothetical protein
MERALGRDGFAIIELPRRNRITSDRFTEFADSFERYRATQCFEDVVAERLAKEAKPLVLTEELLDAKYLRTALQLLRRRAAPRVHRNQVRWQ